VNMPLWFSNLVSWSVQVALLVLAAGVLPGLFQIRQPRVLLAYWRTLLVLSLALPFVQPWYCPPSNSLVVVVRDVAGATLPPPSSLPAAHWRFPALEIVAPILGAVILAGILVRFVILLLGLRKLRQFRENSAPISAANESLGVLEQMQAQMRVRGEFCLSADVDSPVTFGFAAPVILLPERFLLLDPRFQAAIACHELLHVRRHDWVHHLSEEVVRAAFWFHPAIAWVIARMRLAREQVVDLEVVRLTSARKTYLEALLEFTASRTRMAVVPAPPFLVERQLTERVSLMLKEVRMSRRRLIASFVVIGCCLVVAIALALWAFPLKGAARQAQSAPNNGITGGVSGGVAGGVANGVARGVSGGAAQGVAQGVSGGVANGIGGGVGDGVGGEARTGSHADEPKVDISTIWTDTVKRGPMLRQVRGLGTLVRANDSANLIAKVTLPEFMAKDVRTNQNASLATEKGPLVRGHVSSVGQEVVNGTVVVDIALDAVPATVPPQVDAVIDIEKLDNILQIGRPVHVTANSSASLFKIVNDGKEAERVVVKFGRASVNTVEVLDGLKEGDKVILSDMSQWDSAYRIHLTDNMHLEKH